tara:strand:+ start:364 stop:504 length:141 start_codon:yes stop_codon:yes gene_type:complete
MAHLQNPIPIEELASNATKAEQTEKINELVRLLNQTWFTDKTIHTK